MGVFRPYCTCDTSIQYTLYLLRTTVYYIKPYRMYTHGDYFQRSQTLIYLVDIWVFDRIYTVQSHDEHMILRFETEQFSENMPMYAKVEYRAYSLWPIIRMMYLKSRFQIGVSSAPKYKCGPQELTQKCRIQPHRGELNFLQIYLRFSNSDIQ